ncbi:PREDICTED: interactor of constitutive active ROPs 4-like [Nelumbo nucifera]|uniref:Interactor of constitutive active ROPs 4-like n=2 Tax=Nelumbo nucifera TaxID=4432 RepID=A0A1U8BHC3_NELNU|nr:PREDICTED: interactor of constitutive active ROPs 4-like [Nelumbo nucifera]XP_010279621.1 PREDICTED: interactor of constitutive active ROPs 4-like [Nelumbo nucifera]DAD37559.1 TPA_asm: hypothetical protein HUJ06_008200 [Nelumbo nucifera]
MPRSRGSELPQRQSTRAPLHLRTSGHESDNLHHRPTVDRSPKVGERRSPRGAHSDPLHQKKLGTRITDLESQLGQAQEELKKLKEQLVFAEAAKKEAQEELEKKTKEPAAEEATKEVEHLPPPGETRESNEKTSSDGNPDESPEESFPETDVFEVLVETVPSKPKRPTHTTEQQENETKPIEKCAEAVTVLDPVKPALDNSAVMNDEINLLKEKLAEKEKQLEMIREENELLKKKVKEAAVESASFLVMEEESALKLTKMGQELEESKANVARLKQQLETVEGAKVALETEMKKLRVQTEQWRKAADAAAAVLAGGMEMNGRVAGRCGSMDKHLSSGGLETAGGGYTGFVGSPLLGDESDDGFGGGKRKGTGIRMFGDLWKRKGQK